MQGRTIGRTIIYVSPSTRELLRRIKEKYRLKNNSEAILVLCKFFEEEEEKIGQLEMAKKVFSFLLSGEEENNGKEAEEERREEREAIKNENEEVKGGGEDKIKL